MELAAVNNGGNGGARRSSPRGLSSKPITTSNPSPRVGVGGHASPLRQAEAESTTTTYARLEAGWDPENGRSVDPDATIMSRLRKYVQEWRGLDFLVFAAVLVICRMVVPEHRMYIPPTKSVMSVGTIIANNTQFSYPITLKGHICDPSTLEHCMVTGPQSGQHPCCLAIDDDAKPYETVTSQQLFIITTIIPFLLICARYWVMNKWLNSDDLLLRDTLLGYFAAMATTLATTDIIKSAVGYPRPNHYALILLASQTSHTRQAANAYHSFPSGHSSLSMTSMLYVTLLFLHDLRRERGRLAAHYRSLFMVLAWLPVVVAIFIGMTRIVNMFHDRIDVIFGLLIGGGWALAAYHYVMPNHNDHKEDKEEDV